MGKNKEIKKLLKKNERLQNACSKMHNDIDVLINYFNKLENKPVDHNVLEIMFNHETRKVLDYYLRISNATRDYSMVRQVVDSLDKKSGDVANGNVDKLYNNFNISSDKKYEGTYEGTSMFGHSSPPCDNYVPKSVTEYQKVGDVTFQKSELLDKESYCKTSEKWLSEIPSEYNVKILDPDGWNRSNYEYSFKVECISKHEFLKRLRQSTISNSVAFWTSEWLCRNQ